MLQPAGSRGRFPRLAPFLALGLLAPLGAQVPAFRRFTGRDGLPQSQVRVLMEDRRGFLWVGTHGGAARLGPSGFQRFGAEQGLGEGRVRAFLDDRRGHVWVAQSDSELAEVEGNRARIHNGRDGLEDPEALALAEDGEGRVWVGTRRGVYVGGSEGFKRLALPAPWSESTVLSLAWDGHRMWIGGRGGQVAFWEGDAVTAAPLPPPDRAGDRDFLQLRLDPSGRLWALMAHALYRRGPSGWEAQPIPDSGRGGSVRMEGLAFDGDGGLLLSMGADGLCLRRPDGGESRLQGLAGLPEAWAAVAFRDSRGTLWVGTSGDGLCARPLSGLERLPPPPGEDLGAVLSVLELEPGHFLLASSRGLWSWTRGKGFGGHWTTAQGLPTNELWQVEADGSGGAWLATGRGLARWREGKVEAWGEAGIGRVYHLLRHPGGLWVGSDQGLVDLDARGRLRAHSDLPLEVGFNHVYTFLPDGEGLLVGTAQGLYRWEGGRMARVHGDAPFARQRIIALHRDDEGRVWVGTSRGLHRQEGQGWRTFGAEDGLPDAHVYFIAAAGPGRTVVGHGQGVSFVESGRIRTFNQNHGFLANETNQNGVLLDGSGRLWIGMVDGVDLLDLKAPLPDPVPPAPVVMEARWTGGEASLPSGLDLPPKARNLDLVFDLGAPLTARAPRFEVQMTGDGSGGWQRVEGHSVHFGQLSPGVHSFRLRASLDGRSWVEAVPLSVWVRPAWFEHPVGRAVMMLALLAAGAGVVAWRTRRLRLAARELEAKVHERTQALEAKHEALEEAHRRLQGALQAKAEFTNMVAHDLRSPLTSILLVADRLDHDPDAARNPNLLAMVRHEAHRVETLLGRLLDQAKSEALLQALSIRPVTPAGMLEGLADVIRLQAEERGIRFRFEEAPEAAAVEVAADPDAIQQLLQNLAGNALKFTDPGGEVVLGSWPDLDEDAWCLEVRDTGRGMDPADLERLLHPFAQSQGADAAGGWGLGLAITKGLVDGHGGQLFIDSSPGQGTRIRVLLPLLTMPGRAKR